MWGLALIGQVLAAAESPGLRGSKAEDGMVQDALPGSLAETAAADRLGTGEAAAGPKRDLQVKVIVTILPADGAAAAPPRAADAEQHEAETPTGKANPASSVIPDLAGSGQTDLAEAAQPHADSSQDASSTSSTRKRSHTSDPPEDPASPLKRPKTYLEEDEIPAATSLGAKAAVEALGLNGEVAHAKKLDDEAKKLTDEANRLAVEAIENARQEVAKEDEVPSCDRALEDLTRNKKAIWPISHSACTYSAEPAGQPVQRVTCEPSDAGITLVCAIIADLTVHSKSYKLDPEDNGKVITWRTFVDRKRAKHTKQGSPTKQRFPREYKEMMTAFNKGGEYYEEFQKLTTAEKAVRVGLDLDLKLDGACSAKLEKGEDIVSKSCPTVLLQHPDLPSLPDCKAAGFTLPKAGRSEEDRSVDRGDWQWRGRIEYTCG